MEFFISQRKQTNKNWRENSENIVKFSYFYFLSKVFLVIMFHFFAIFQLPFIFVGCAECYILIQRRDQVYSVDWNFLILELSLTEYSQIFFNYYNFTCNTCLLQICKYKSNFLFLILFIKNFTIENIIFKIQLNYLHSIDMLVESGGLVKKCVNGFGIIFFVHLN